MPRPLHNILEELINLRKLPPKAQTYKPRLEEVIKKIAAEQTKAEGKKPVDSKNLDKLFNLDLLRQYHELRLSTNYEQRKKGIKSIADCKWENPFNGFSQNNSKFGTQSATCREIQRIRRLIEEETEAMPEGRAEKNAAIQGEVKRVKNALDTDAENLIAQRAVPLAVELRLELMRSVQIRPDYWQKKIEEYKTTGLQNEQSTFKYYCKKYGDSVCQSLLRFEVEKQIPADLKAKLPKLSGGARRRRQTRRKQAKGKGKKSTRRR